MVRLLILEPRWSVLKPIAQAAELVQGAQNVGFFRPSYAQPQSTNHFPSRGLLAKVTKSVLLPESDSAYYEFVRFNDRRVCETLCHHAQLEQT